MDDNAIYALRIIQKYNHIRNDLDSYLYEVAEWGIGNRKDMPDAKDYGVVDNYLSPGWMAG